MKYLVSHQGLALGPLALDEVITKVKSKELDVFDYIFDEQKEDWILLMEFPLLAEILKVEKPPRPPLPQTQTQSQTSAKVPSAHVISEWFVLKGENRFGPFTYTDLVKMHQQKVVFPFDFIWHAGFENWKRLAELDDFKPNVIRGLFAQDALKKGLFLERKFSRKPYEGRVIVHNNHSYWKGEGFEISRGGVGLYMSHSLVVPGQQVSVHFKKHDTWPAFNATCEVVSKKFVKDDAPVQYGFRFLSLSQEVQEEFYRKVT